jgi:hypothetical protein
MSRSSQRIIAGFIGLIFLAAGILKALDPAAFAVDILNYRILPWTCDVLLALYLPWLEIVCGAELLLRIGHRGALCIVAALLAAFIGAYASTRVRGLDVACGCFGHGAHRGYWSVLVVDAILLGTVTWLLRADFRPLSPVIRSGTAAS